MRKVPLLALLAGALLIAGCQPSSAQGAGGQGVLCTRAFVLDGVSATAMTYFVSPQAGKIVSICGYDLNPTGAGETIQFFFGSGTNCGTNTIKITPAYALAANAGLSSRAAVAAISSDPGGGACFATTGAGTYNAVIYYGQF